MPARCRLPRGVRCAGAERCGFFLLQRARWARKECKYIAIHCTPNAGKDMERAALAVRVQHIEGNLGDVGAELTFTYRRGS